MFELEVEDNGKEQTVENGKYQLFCFSNVARCDIYLSWFISSVPLGNSRAADHLEPDNFITAFPNGGGLLIQPKVIDALSNSLILPDLAECCSFNYSIIISKPFSKSLAKISQCCFSVKDI